jgi:ribosomal protein S27AE
MAHDVFISYASEDKTIADAVCARLEERYIRCWIAPRDILYGEDYPKAIVRAIDASRIMVIVFSAHANASGSCKREVHESIEKGKHIIPFRVEHVEPTDDMEWYLGTKHWLDALTLPLEDHLHRLARVIQTILTMSPIDESPPPSEESIFEPTLEPVAEPTLTPSNVSSQWEHPNHEQATREPVTSSERFCPKCSFMVSNTARFCRKCGFKL